ncbi:MAG TPA: TIGR02281 family clan AA aspartic protease [Xanthobacteraceae bacterium]|nr:TIGR02281 family clan AA aspartic protease [Xanthobacteraceae bacterium]
MRSFMPFAILACLLAGFAPRLADQLGNRHPATPAAATGDSLAAPAVAGPRSVVIARATNGHFDVEGVVDGRRLNFIVDTGASAVTLNSDDAARLGLHPAERDFTAALSTANGVIRGAPVRLNMVEVGDIMVRDVAAVIVPVEALRTNLLGLTFLSRLHHFDYRDGKLRLEE